MLRRSLVVALLSALAGAALSGAVGAAGRPVDALAPAAEPGPALSGAPVPAFSYQYTVRSATWRSSALANGSEEDPVTVYHGKGRVQGRIASGARGHLASLGYFPASGGAGAIVAVFDLTNRWDETLEFRDDPPEYRTCGGSDRERLTLRVQLRMAPRSRRVVATYRVFDPHLQEHVDRRGRYCSSGILPRPTEGRSVFDVSKFLERRTILLFEGRNQPTIIGDFDRSSVTTVTWGFAITLERRSGFPQTLPG